jgi:protein-glutamine gamma-glutamyltransferase
VRRGLWVVIGLLVWGVAAGLLAAPQSVTAGIVAAVLGSALGVLAGFLAGRSRLRLVAIWAGGVLAWLLLRGLSALALRSVGLASWLGAGRTYALSEALFWLATGVIVVGVLETSSRRVPALVALEIVAVGTVLASVLAGHRDGFINRPFALVDELWSRGWDPLPFFVAAGAAAAAILALLAAHRGSRRRSIRDAVLLVALLVAVFLIVPITTLKDLAPFQQGGSRADTKGHGRTGQGQGQGGQEQRNGPGGGRGQGQTMSSFSDQPRGSANSPLAVVVLHDDYDPPAGYYYLRQTAFSQFNGMRLVQDTSGLADLDLPDAFPTDKLAVQTEHPTVDFLTPLDTTVALIRPHPRPFALANAVELRVVTNPDPARFLRAFDVTSEVLAKPLPDLAGLAVGSRRWSREVRGHYTSAPTDPRFAALDREIVRLLKPKYRDDPFAQAAVIQYWLGENSVYSLSSGHESAADPVADFLFGDRTGHCVFLAHSAALLFRAQGIPARVGAGYAVDARNRGSGSAVLVRERDAHAWPEIFLDGAGWVVMDIAPAKSLVPPDEAPDTGLQQMLGEMARGQGKKPPVEQPPPAHGNLQELLRQLLVLAARALLPVLGALLVAAYAVKLWRRLVPRWAGERELPRVAYRAALDRLAETRRQRQYGQTREAFARSLAASVPTLGPLTELHLQAKLGREPRRVGRNSYSELGRRLGREVAATTPWPWRLLAQLNPIAWMLVR